jgi:hypothetical protein
VEHVEDVIREVFELLLSGEDNCRATDGGERTGVAENIGANAFSNGGHDEDNSGSSGIFLWSIREVRLILLLVLLYEFLRYDVEFFKE